MKFIPMYIIDSSILGTSRYYSLMIGPLMKNLSSKTRVNKILLVASKFPNRKHSAKVLMLQA